MKLNPVTAIEEPTYPAFRRALIRAVAVATASAALLAVGCGEGERMAGDVTPVRPPGAMVVTDPPKPPETPTTPPEPEIADPPKPPDTPDIPIRTSGARPAPRVAGRMAPAQR